MVDYSQFGGGLNLGNVLANVDAIKTARLRDKSYALADQERQFRLDAATRAQADEEQARRLRGAAFAGDRKAIEGLAVIAPDEAIQFQSYFSGLDEKRRAEELAQAAEATDQMGKTLAWVKGAATEDEAHQRYDMVRQNLPESARKGLPETFNPQWVDMTLARMMDMDKILAASAAEKGTAAFKAAFAPGTAPSAPEIERSPGAPVPGPQQGNTGPSENARAAFSRLVNEHGMSPHQAAGLVGNWQVESGSELNPSAYNPKEDAVGIGQWRADRKANLQAFAAERGMNPADLNTQVDFAVWEMRGPEAAAGQKLGAAQSAAEAAALVDQHYERSDGRTREQRAANAEALLADGGATAGTPGGPLSGMDPQLAQIMQLQADPNLSGEQRAAVSTVLEMLKPKAPPAPYTDEGKRAADISAGYIDPNAPKPVDAKGEMDLRKEYAAIPLVKDNQTQTSAFGRIAAAAQDPSAAGDLALIYGFMKLQDPGSVVRETEFATAQNAAGVPEVVRNIWNKILTGERLAPEQRKDFLTVAQRLMDASNQQVAPIKEQYRGLATAAGLDPTRVVTDYSYAGPVLPAGTGAAPATGGPVQIQTVDDYNALPSGTPYLDPQGNQRVKR